MSLDFGPNETVRIKQNEKKATTKKAQQRKNQAEKYRLLRPETFRRNIHDKISSSLASVLLLTLDHQTQIDVIFEVFRADALAYADFPPIIVNEAYKAIR